MTTNQLAYRAQLETERSNLAREAETQRHNLATEDLGLKELAERIRSNKANERIKWADLSEKQRSNLANEAIETFKAYEAARHNQEVEKETNRSNLAREAETYRSNLAKETETHRSNVVQEQETHRHNQQTESLGWANHAENVRSNKENERIKWNSNTITMQHYERMDHEQSLHNQVTEAIQAEQLEVNKAMADADIALKSAMADKTEVERQNLEKELAYKTDAWLKSMENKPHIENARAVADTVLKYISAGKTFTNIFTDIANAKSKRMDSTANMLKAATGLLSDLSGVLFGVV